MSASILNPGHRMLRGLRFLTFCDNTFSLRNFAGHYEDQGVVTNGAASRLRGWSSLVGNGSDKYITFGAFNSYIPSASRSLTVMVRCRTTGSSGAVASARNTDRSAGWLLLINNVGGVEDGYNFAVFGGGNFMEAADEIGASTQSGKDVVVAGVYNHLAKTSSMWTRQPEDNKAKFRSSNTNFNSDPATTDWDIRASADMLIHALGGESFFFTGDVAWMAVFDRALNRAEIEEWSRDEEWAFLRDEELVQYVPPPPPPPPPPPAIPPSIAMPLTARGPAVPGSIFFRASLVQTFTTPIFVPVPVPTPPSPSVPGGSPVRPFVPRDPLPDPRIRRHTEIVADIFNSLMGKGFLQQVGISSWAILPSTYREARAPGPGDDESVGVLPGAIWLDLSQNVGYMNITNTNGAAVWKQITN